MNLETKINIKVRDLIVTATVVIAITIINIPLLQQETVQETVQLPKPNLYCKRFQKVNPFTKSGFEGFDIWVQEEKIGSDGDTYISFSYDKEQTRLSVSSLSNWSNKPTILCSEAKENLEGK